jgi:hypothetical protein
MVFTLNYLLKASMTSLIASGVPIMPQSSTYIMTKYSGSSPLAVLINRHGSALLEK